MTIVSALSPASIRFAQKKDIVRESGSSALFPWNEDAIPCRSAIMSSYAESRGVV